MTSTGPHDHERSDISGELAKQRGFLRQTTRGISDEQARMRTTTSELTLGGLIKHVTAVEAMWTRFIVEGPSVMGPMDASAAEGHAATFRVEPGETLAHLLDAYEGVAARTEELIGGLDSLDSSQPLPEAPWFAPGARWSARQVLLHILAETAQHSGHADIIREALDGAKTMG